PPSQKANANYTNYLRLASTRSTSRRWVPGRRARRARPPYGQMGRSAMRRQQIPDAGVFRAENPGAESLETTIFHQRIALAKGAGIRKKDPFPQVIPVEIEPRRTVCGVPLDVAVIGFGEIERIVRGDIFGGGVGLVAGFVARVGLDRRASKPVIAIE